MDPQLTTNSLKLSAQMGRISNYTTGAFFSFFLFLYFLYSFFSFSLFMLSLCLRGREGALRDSLCCYLILYWPICPLSLEYGFSSISKTSPAHTVSLWSDISWTLFLSLLACLSLDDCMVGESYMKTIVM